LLLEHRRRQSDLYEKARREEQKMDSLQEREAERERSIKELAEMKRMDAAAIQKFNHGRK
jgi:flagellar biosynthesis chaperone FliJ